MIEIDLKANYPDIKRALNSIGGKITKMPDLTRNIAGIMEDAVMENFEQGGRPAWDDLAESTKKARRDKGKWPGQILVLDARLKGSVESSHGDNSAFVFVAGKDFPYAAIHQFGGEAGRRDHRVQIKARPYLTLHQTDIDEIEHAITTYLRNL